MSHCELPYSDLKSSLLILQTFPFMCVFLLAAGLSLLNHSGSRGAKIGPVVL
jgi:hypothetical protein